MPYQPRATLDNPYGPLVQFRTEDILPPAAVYVAPDDQIVANAFTNVAGGVLNLVIRLLRPDGTLSVEVYNTFSAGNPIIGGIIVVPPSEGYLLSVLVSSSNVSVGQMYAQVELTRGAGTPTPLIACVLLAGYVSNVFYLCYPPTEIQPPFAGAGYLRYVTTVAGAGADWSVTVPPRTRWRLISVTAQLATDATAGNRTVTLQVADNLGNISLAIPAPNPQAPSTTTSYSWGSGMMSSAASGVQTIGLPTELELSQGQVVSVSTAGKGAGDQWSKIVLYVEEWIGN